MLSGMKLLAMLAVLPMLAAPAPAQKKGGFPLTAKVISSASEEADPITRGPDNWRTLVIYETVVTAEINGDVYKLSGGSRLPLLAPGEYPASIKKETVHLLVNGKDCKLHVMSISQKS